MPDDLTTLSGSSQIGNLMPELGTRGLPPSLQILLNEGLYERVKQLAGVMSRARGFTPAHLIDKAEACFAIINMSMDWKLSPHFVARHTYQTPGGAIGHDGVLVQAILEQSGRFIGSPVLEYRGDWQTLTGKFEVKTSAKGNSFVAPTWKAADATGLGIIVRWRVRGEEAPRVWPGESEPFWLTQCYPLNSPLWATDPKTQIGYLAIRRFANLTSPGILGAASFDHDELLDASERAIDITEPRREDFTQQRQVEPEPEPEPQFAVIDLDGVEHLYQTVEGAEKALTLVLQAAAARGSEALAGMWEANTVVEHMPPEMIGRMSKLHAEVRQQCAEREKAPEPAQDAPQTQGSTAPATAATQEPKKATPARSAKPADDLLGGADKPKTEKAATPQQTEPKTVDHVEGEGSVTERQSLEIAPVMDRGKEDWRAWWVALFSPKMRQATDDSFPWLLGDNEKHLEATRRALGAADIDAAIKARWAELSPPQ